ncbi:galanin receptor 2a-like [Diadema antillarum]|uniref:galanin receptor 2a-like n=1 Tax=Diadema antillarum TaxID=105358 RepID=UPI003A894EA5
MASYPRSYPPIGATTDVTDVMTTIVVGSSEVFPPPSTITSGCCNLAEIGDVTTTERTRVAELPKRMWTVHALHWEWWTIIQAISAGSGIVGNLLVIAVIFRIKFIGSSSSTDTLIGALAVADFLTSVFLIPIPTISNIPSTFLGEVYCKVVYTARCMWTSVSASIFTLTAISVERFVAVTFPIKFRVLFNQKRTNLAIILIWSLACLLNSFAFFIFHVDSDTASCVIRFPTKNGSEILGISSYIFVLILPIIVMLVAQCLTVHALHLESLHFVGNTGLPKPRVRLLQAKRRVIRLILIINVTFIVCWTPNQTMYLAFNLGLLPESYLYGALDRGLVVLAFANSCANPIIYGLQNPRFRSAVGKFWTSAPRERMPVFG